MISSTLVPDQAKGLSYRFGRQAFLLLFIDREQET
nr:MAG TPA: hypothetical protein [Caudoviricetes sp.]